MNYTEDERLRDAGMAMNRLAAQAMNAFDVRGIVIILLDAEGQLAGAAGFSLDGGGVVAETVNRIATDAAKDIKEPIGWCGNPSAGGMA